MKKTKNTMHSQTIRSERLMIHSKQDLSMTGLRAAISITRSVKEGPR